MMTKAQSKRSQQEERVTALAFDSRLEDVCKQASLRFRGDGRTLESAVGALVLGQIYGWRVLRLIHGAAAYRRYEQILGVRFKDLCPERGPLATRSVALRLADRLGGFWKVATGKVKGGRTSEIDDEVDLPYEAD